jgi:hypothetical protein
VHDYNHVFKRIVEYKLGQGMSNVKPVERMTSAFTSTKKRQVGSEKQEPDSEY